MDKIIEFAHKLLKEKLKKTDVAIDMTLGNGYDSLFLAPLVEKVYAFDIQEQAIIQAKQTLKDVHNVIYIHQGHENVDKYVFQKVKGIIFNLGYLPKGSKQICTTAKTTLIALKKAIRLLDVGGICVLVFYPGHKEGKIEAQEVGEYLQTLDQKEFDIIKYEFINQINMPPFLIALERLKP